MNQPWAATLKCLTFCLCKVPTCASTVFTFVQIFLSKNLFLPNSPHSFMDAEAVTRTNKSWCSGWYRGWCKLDHEPKYCHCIIECTREDTVKSLFLYVSVTLFISDENNCWNYQAVIQELNQCIQWTRTRSALTCSQLLMMLLLKVQNPINHNCSDPNFLSPQCSKWNRNWWL